MKPSDYHVSASKRKYCVVLEYPGTASEWAAMCKEIENLIGSDDQFGATTNAIGAPVVYVGTDNQETYLFLRLRYAGLGQYITQDRNE